MAIRKESPTALSEEQLREYNDAFAMYDKKNKGYITNAELKHLLRSSGFNPTDTEVDHMCMAVDYNGNGKVDFNEFLDLMQNLKNNKTEEENCVDAFRAFDIYDRGFIESSDLRQILMTVMKERSEDDKYLIKKVFYLEQNRRISYDEFKLMISPKT